MRHILLLLFLTPCALTAQFHFTFTPACDSAYQALMQLRLKHAGQWITTARQQDANNLIPVYLANYIDFFQLYMQEDEAMYYQIMHRKQERLKQLANGPKTSPYFLFCQAEVRIQWAIARLKFKEYLGAFADVRKAYRMLEANLHFHPHFTLSQKSMGVLQAVIGAIPDQYQWGTELLGMEGTIRQGVKALQQLQRSSDPAVQRYHKEIDLLLAYLSLHLANDPASAWAIVSAPRFCTPDNLLAHFVKASIAMHIGKNEIAINTLHKAPRGPAYAPFPYLDFMLGLAYARQGNTRGITYFQQFLANFNGRNYRKEACQKIAWLHLIKGNTKAYTIWMEKVKDTGADIIGPDKAAQQEAVLGEIPNSTLTLARLWYDGGYYQKALHLLKKYTRSDFTRHRDQLEFTYRMGRILQALDEKQLAEGFYLSTLKHDDASGYYFAPSAALQLGLMYEGKGNITLAEAFFNRCLGFDDYPYQSGIDRQAKAGLQRIKK